ncbi:MAG: hypothetical protein WCJ71_06550 [Candidatus Omnitrophota bacterium]
MQKKRDAGIAVLSSHWKKKQFEDGMTGEEILAVLRKLKINPSKFWKKLGINTCIVDKETKKVLHYHCDIETALICCIENREKHLGEWD